MSVNLDELRAARREAAGEGVELILGGHAYKLPVELPLDALPFIASIVTPSEDLQGFHENCIGLLKLLLDREGFKAFRALKPSVDDVQDLITGVLKEYGVDQGKADASKP